MAGPLTRALIKPLALLAPVALLSLLFIPTELHAKSLDAAAPAIHATGR